MVACNVVSQASEKVRRKPRNPLPKGTNNNKVGPVRGTVEVLSKRFKFVALRRRKNHGEEDEKQSPHNDNAPMKVFSAA